MYPVHGMADFEQAIKNAVLAVAVFERMDVHSCHFHFGLAVIKKLKLVKLQSDYLNTPAIKKWGKKYVVLCTLPAHFIQDELAKLRWETAAYPNRLVKKKKLKLISSGTVWLRKLWQVLQHSACNITLTTR